MLATSGRPYFARHDVRTCVRIWLAVGAQSRMSSRIRVCFVACCSRAAWPFLIGIAFVGCARPRRGERLASMRSII
eukprot:11081307-Alexandrium_andersonii.AAC.1